MDVFTFHMIALSSVGEGSARERHATIEIWAEDTSSALTELEWLIDNQALLRRHLRPPTDDASLSWDLDRDAPIE